MAEIVRFRKTRKEIMENLVDFLKEYKLSTKLRLYGDIKYNYHQSGWQGFITNPMSEDWKDFSEDFTKYHMIQDILDFIIEKKDAVLYVKQPYSDTKHYFCGSKIHDENYVLVK